MTLKIRPLASDDVEKIEVLSAESTSQGFLFVARFLHELKNSTRQLHEAHCYFLGVFEGEELMAIGGVTPDPYTDDPNVGRIRHVYVAQVARRRGVGRQLMQELERLAANTFMVLRLRTDTSAAAAFYESIGYTRTGETNATHYRDVNRY